MLEELDLKITVFVVGQDAALEKNYGALASISAAGHEIANHSFNHEPWLHLYTPSELEQEFERSEQAIMAATGKKPVGFRGPGFSFSDEVLKTLIRRGYQYDCSTNQCLQDFPSYLDLVVPRILQVLEELDLKITVFVVGQDAALEKNYGALASISAAGHEIANHSFNHEPWLHLYTPSELEQEFERSEQAIMAATGKKPVGFRGPGFSFSDEVLKTLIRRGYQIQDRESFKCWKNWT